MDVGIESINAYVGQASLDVRTLFEARDLELKRFDNLMMVNKSVGLPCEDPVSNGVNAAKPIIEQMSPEDKNKIELVITSTESGLDFGKSLSTYIHQYLGLNKECRLFEVKQACYGGTAALQMGANFIASGASPGAKALIISTDAARTQKEMKYFEPSQGVGAVAMLVSDKPDILRLDFGANGYHGYEVMDTCRPKPNLETGNPDLSLLAYIDCLEQCFQNYLKRKKDTDIETSFDYLTFHTPYPGMVKNAHRNLLRVLKKIKPDKIDEDFKRRVEPSLSFSSQVGNIYSASLFLGLCGLLHNADIQGSKRVGMFSYGSGCSSEFYSGVITPLSKEKLSKMRIDESLKNRLKLTMAQYDRLLDLNMKLIFGIENETIDFSGFQDIYDQQFKGKGLLVLKEIKAYHREYVWS